MASKVPSGRPTAAEFGELRAYLAKNKVSQAEIEAAIGKTVSGRNRAEIVELLKAWLRKPQRVNDAGIFSLCGAY